MACPSRPTVEGMAPLSATQVQFICGQCGYTGTDLEIYQQWKARFNLLPPPPEGGFQPNLYAWIAANFTP